MNAGWPLATNAPCGLDIEESILGDCGLKLDETDWALLRLLERDGRMTNKQLARAVGLSPAACHARIRKLEMAGVILGYRAVLNWRRLGADFEAWAEVVLNDANRSDAFVAFLTGSQTIVSAQRLAQPNVFLLHLVAVSSGCWREFLDAAMSEGFSLDVVRFNLALACVKPIRSPTRAHLHRAA